jgi:hypothetical protein
LDQTTLWAADVGQVSQFLDDALTVVANDLRTRAETALTFEKDESGYKAAIDRALGMDARHLSCD